MKIVLISSCRVASTDIPDPFSPLLPECCRGQPEGSLFNSYYAEFSGRALLLSLNCSTYPWSLSLKYLVLSKEILRTIFFWVFGMTRPGIELQSPAPLVRLFTNCLIQSQVKSYQRLPKLLYDTSSSSCRATSTDIPDPLSTLLPIVHRL